MIHWNVVSAVFWRNLKQYFSGPLGYLFIVVFVTVCAIMAFSPQFFADNLANLDQLSRWYPVLLLFFVPAITMSVWADEKRQGTDSILFTLPASDFDILLGKYLSVVAVYTIALLFSMTQLIVLRVIGDPDWGVIFTTYVGYWLTGLALLAIGMFASSLTRSATVAFVLGALLCAIPVLMGYYFRGVEWYGIRPEFLGVDWYFEDFTIGLIPLTSVAYFLSLTVLMLYLNLVVISRRHWYRGEQLSLGSQYFLRSVSLAVALAAFVFLCMNAVSSLWTRADLTSEKLYTLNQATSDTLNNVRENDRAVTIQAFVSRDVPRKFVNTKKQFIGLLRQFDEIGGSNVTVRFVNVDPNSDAALDAKQSGIEPQRDRTEVGGRMVEQDVYLGAAISSSMGDVTIPFIDEETSIEYELSRSLATAVDKSQQITIGIVSTDAHFGGPEFEGRRLDWCYNTTIEELTKQFKLKYIAQEEIAAYLDPPADDQNEEGSTETTVKPNAKTPPDVLLVADPSSLDDVGMAALIGYVEAGNPTLIMADPLPFFWTYQNPTNLGVLNAPRMPRVSQQSPYRQILTSSMRPKADSGTASNLMKAIGVDWDNGTAAWSLDDPHPNFRGATPEYYDGWQEYYGPYEKAFVFVRNHGDIATFNEDNLLSSGLKELLFFYPGSIRKSVDSPFEFETLVKLGPESGSTPWDRLTKTPVQQVRSIDPRTGRMSVDSQPARSQITMDELVVIEPFPQTSLDEDEHVVAAKITGSGEKKLNVVFIADLDFLSDLYYSQEEALGQRLDNLSMLQNAIEVLAGNESFVTLRNRRSKPRTLVTLESVFEQYREERAKKQEDAESRIRDELAEEQKRLDDATKEIQANQSLSFFQKLQRTSQEASDAQRRFDIRSRKLDRELKQTIDQLETEEQNRITNVENWTRVTAVLTAPLPALILGFVVLWIRYSNEQRNVTPERKVKS